MPVKALKFRIKGKTNWLDKLATQANFVWNYVNELSFKTIKNKAQFLGAYDIQKYLTGATKDPDLNLLSCTVQEIAQRYVVCRALAKKRKLRWRISSGRKQSLGWIPFKSRAILFKNGWLSYGRFKFRVWDSYGLGKYKFRAGSFSQDANRHWYISIFVSITDEPTTRNKAVGIDLGLKKLVTTSYGKSRNTKKIYRKYEKKLATAQRAKKKDRIRKLHTKISNKRKDFNHKLSTLLTKNYNKIFVGDVSSSRLAKTKMAKSVFDAGWHQLKTMLEYKANARRVTFLVVDERWTSRTCSVCKNRTGPKGLGGLGIREWVCSECGAVHDRDVNAAKNILALGLQRLAEGIPEKEGVKNEDWPRVKSKSTK